jgi:hypothetical protein
MIEEGREGPMLVTEAALISNGSSGEKRVSEYRGYIRGFLQVDARSPEEAGQIMLRILEDAGIIVEAPFDPYVIPERSCSAPVIDADRENVAIILKGLV